MYAYVSIHGAYEQNNNLYNVDDWLLGNVFDEIYEPIEISNALLSDEQ